MWSLCTSLVPRVLQHLCVETSLVLPTQTVWFPETYSIHACIVPPTCLSPTRHTNVILAFFCWFMETHNFLAYVSITVQFQRVTNVILVTLRSPWDPQLSCVRLHYGTVPKSHKCDPCESLLAPWDPQLPCVRLQFIIYLYFVYLFLNLILILF